MDPVKVVVKLDDTEGGYRRDTETTKGRTHTASNLEKTAA